MLRRSLATATAVIALALPLSSCGFEYATQRDYTPGAGTTELSGDVDILSAVVVSSSKGKGTLIASFSNNLTGKDDAQKLVAITGKRISTSEGVEETPVEVAAFQPVEIRPDSLVNLAQPAEAEGKQAEGQPAPEGEQTDAQQAGTDILVTGDFEAGNFLELTFEFESGEKTTMSVPVVDGENGDWEGLDAS